MTSTSPMTLPTYLPHLTPQESIVDAIYRCLQGLDDNDESLLRSAFSTSIIDPAVFDASFFIPGPDSVYTGIETIVSRLKAAIWKLDTLHQVGNVRTHIDQDAGKAWLTAYAFAQHKRSGEGLMAEKGGVKDFSLNGNRYEMELVREKVPRQEAEWWVIQKFVLKGQLSFGDRAVLQG